MGEPKSQVLVVEDDTKIANLVVDYLVADGLAGRSIADGAEALRAIRRQTPSLLILDVMLPGMDGLTLCREVRSFSDLPIIMMTARIDEIDRLMGLNGGADDYVCKPFSPSELMARVRAQLRRADGRLRAAAQPWQIDEERLRIAWRGEWLVLTLGEFRILRHLLRHPGRAFTRDQLLDAMHADERDVSDRAVDTHIKNLRRKLQAVDGGFDRIASIYGVGYSFDP